jgi:predicted RNase H-like HicB family nuclease
MDLKNSINAIISPGEKWGYVAECLEISVVTQGDTLDEVVRNLQEAVTLHLEGEDPRDFGLVMKPSLLITFQLQLQYA